MKRVYVLIGVLGGYVCIAALLVHLFALYKENSMIKASSIFQDAIKEESVPIQKEMVVHYDPSLSPNDIVEDEKANWVVQSILNGEDPHRIRLDSLFRVRLSENGLPFETLVFGMNQTVAEKKQFSSFLQHATALKPVVFRKDYEKVSDIVLQGYIRISFWDFVRHSGLTVFLLGLLVPVGLMVYGVWGWIKQKPAPTALLSEPEEEKPEVVSVNPQIMVLSKGIFYDETLHKVWSEQGGEPVLLTGQKGELFSKLVKAGDFFATYEQLYGKGYKAAGKSAKQSVQTAIARLKEALKPISVIDIVSIANVGYRLDFH